MLAARHVYNNKSPVNGNECDPFPPAVPPSGMAGVWMLWVSILNFPGLIAVHWREPARSPRLFPTTPTPNPAVGDEVVAM